MKLTFDKLLRGSAQILFYRLSGALLAFVTQVLLARWLGAAELGLYVLAFSWCILLSNAAAVGLPTAAMRFVPHGLVNNNAGYVRGFLSYGSRTTVKTSIAVTLVGLIVVVASRELLAEGLPPALGIALLAIPFYTVMSVHLGVANAWSWYNTCFLPNNLLRPMFFLLAVWAAYAMLPALSAPQVMALQTAAIVVVSLGAIAVVRRRARRVGGGDLVDDRRLWLRTSMPLMLVTLFTNYFPEMNVIVLGSVLPSEQVAIYNACFRTALLISFGLFAVDAFVGPKIAAFQANGDHAHLQEIVVHATRLRSFGAAVVLVIFVVVGEWLLGLFGPDFVVGYPILIILAFAQFVHATVGPVTRLLSIGGHQDRCLYVFSVSIVLLIVLTLVLAPRYGMIGAAAAASVALLTSSLWMAALVIRHMRIRPTLLNSAA